MRRLKTLAVVLVFMLCLGGVMAGCNNAGSNLNSEEDSVTSIRLRYNGAPIPGNSHTVALSVGTLEYTADIQVTGNASKDFTLASSDTGIVTVSGRIVNLIAEGQTKITATAAGDSIKKHTVTLNIVDNTPYSISVTGGIADKETALAGHTVTLTAGTQAGKVFSDWTIKPTDTTPDWVPPDVIMLSANSFEMPRYNVTVTGNFEDAGGTQKPSNITNNFGKDSSAEFLALWHNDSAVTEQTLQIVPAAGSFADTQGITPASETWKGTAASGDYAERNVFRAHVTGLSPNTRYKYRMGAAGAWSEVYYHLTSSESFSDFSFTVVTDPQSSAHSDMSVTLRAADAFDEDNRFYLMLGDIVDDIGKKPAEIASYTNAASEFNRYRPIAATQGNHDTYRGNATQSDQYVFGEATVFNRFVTFPDNGWDTNPDKANRSQAYYFYYNNVLIIMLNTMATSNATGTSSPNHTQQAAWLRQVLEYDRQNGLSKYTIVGTHISPFTGRTVDRWLAPEVRAAYGPICTEYGVDLFFAGHDHMYGRTNPIKIETGNTALSQITFASTPGGTIYSIVGATGPKFYTIDNDTAVGEYFPLRVSFPSPGVFVNVKVTAEKLTVTVRRLNSGTIDTYEVAAK